MPTRRRSSRRLAAAALAVVATTTLSACSSLPPGVAAEVEGEEISAASVDDLAEILCVVGQLPQGEDSSTKSARQQALGLLLINEIAAQVSDPDAVDPAAVQQQVAGFAQAREALPESQRDTFDAFAEDLARAQIGVTELGRASLEESGEDAAAITPETAFQEGERLRQEYAADADIEVSPRFGDYQDGTVVPDPGSLSVPVTDLAVQGSQAPGEAGAAPSAGGQQLPASQTCG